jgi:hypothetical protein
MLRSAEVRWFFNGRASSEVVDSFLGPSDLQEERRIDLYLPFAGNDSVGFKLRKSDSGQAALELKVQTTNPRELRFQDGQVGRSAAWVKWSGKVLGSAADAPIDASTDEAWMSVEKVRRLRKVAFSAESVTEVDASSRPSEGCTYELSVLRLNHADWWTLALETFGSPNSLESRLKLAGDWFFARYPSCQVLRCEDSWSYPAWLGRLALSTR